MTVEEFLKKHNYAPYDYEEVAILLSKIDDPDVSEVGKVFLEAKEAFEMTLDDIGFEFG